METKKLQNENKTKKQLDKAQHVLYANQLMFISSYLFSDKFLKIIKITLLKMVAR